MKAKFYLKTQNVYFNILVNTRIFTGIFIFYQFQSLCFFLANPYILRYIIDEVIFKSRFSMLLPSILVYVSVVVGQVILAFF